MNMMTPEQRYAMQAVLKEVGDERIEQHLKWGEQNHPNFSAEELQNVSPEDAKEAADSARQVCQDAFANNQGSYSVILIEEFGEMFGEMHNDPAALRAELIQVAAVAVAWVEKIDRDLKRNNDGKAD